MRSIKRLALDGAAAQSAALTALEERYPGSKAAFAEGKQVYARVK